METFNIVVKQGDISVVRQRPISDFVGRLDTDNKGHYRFCLIKLNNQYALLDWTSGLCHEYGLDPYKLAATCHKRLCATNKTKLNEAFMKSLWMLKVADIPYPANTFNSFDLLPKYQPQT